MIGDLGFVKLAIEVFKLVPGSRWLRRGWYSLFGRRALRDFRYLEPLVQGLREQDAQGEVNPTTLATLAAELEALSVFPPAIRFARGSDQLKKELAFLWTCMGATADHLSLPIARKRFKRRAALSDPDWTNDALGEMWDRLQK